MTSSWDLMDLDKDFKLVSTSARMVNWITTAMERTREFLAKLTPESNPLFWVAVNGICALYSAILLCIFFWFEDDSKGMELAERYYLVYDFVTTFVWCFESGLNVAFIRNDGTDQSYSSTSWGQIVMFVLAMVFLVDSGRVLYQWKTADEDPDITTVIVIFSFVGYLLVFLDAYRTMQKRRLGHDSVPEVRDETLKLQSLT